SKLIGMGCFSGGSFRRAEWDICVTASTRPSRSSPNVDAGFELVPTNSSEAFCEKQATPVECSVWVSKGAQPNKSIKPATQPRLLRRANPRRRMDHFMDYLRPPEPKLGGSSVLHRLSEGATFHDCIASSIFSEKDAVRPKLHCAVEAPFTGI